MVYLTQRATLSLCLTVFVYALLSGWLPDVYAQTFPTKPIRLIVPYAAGGGTDVLARGLALRLSRARRPTATRFCLIQAVMASTQRFIQKLLLIRCTILVASATRLLNK